MASQKFIDTALSIHLLFILGLYSDTTDYKVFLKHVSKYEQNPICWLGHLY